MRATVGGGGGHRNEEFTEADRSFDDTLQFLAQTKASLSPNMAGAMMGFAS